MEPLNNKFIKNISKLNFKKIFEDNNYIVYDLFGSESNEWNESDESNNLPNPSDNQLVLIFKKLIVSPDESNNLPSLKKLQLEDSSLEIMKYVIYANTINESIDETLYDALRYPEYSYGSFYVKMNIHSGKSKKIFPKDFLLEDEYTYKPYYNNSTIINPSNFKDPEGPICKKYYDFTSNHMIKYLQKDISNFIFYDINDVIKRIIEKI